MLSDICARHPAGRLGDSSEIVPAVRALRSVLAAMQLGPRATSILAAEMEAGVGVKEGSLFTWGEAPSLMALMCDTCLVRVDHGGALKS